MVAAVLLAAFAFPMAASQAVMLPPNGATIHRTEIAAKVLVLSGNEVRGQRISTGPDELLQVLFADGTALTVGRNSEATIDSFVFNPSENTATLEATLARGAFRFIGGRTTETPDGVSLRTPFGTLAIAQASADISLGGEGEPPHFDLIFGGSLTLSRGGSELARVRQPGYSIAPDEGGGPSAAVTKTPTEWRKTMIEKLT